MFVSAVTSSLAFVTLESEECDLSLRNFRPTLSKRYQEAVEAKEEFFQANDVVAKAETVTVRGKITVSF